jgi:hypothetical protein
VTAPNGVTTQQGQPVPGSSASSRPTDPSGRVVFYDSPTSSKHSSSSEESSQRTGWINMPTAPISPPHYVVQLYPRGASGSGSVGVPIHAIGPVPASPTPTRGVARLREIVPRRVYSTSSSETTTGSANPTLPTARSEDNESTGSPEVTPPPKRTRTESLELMETPASNGARAEMVRMSTSDAD